MTTSNEEYNGWANYETWCVNMWLSNEEAIDSDVRDLVAGVMGEEFTGDQEDAQRQNRYDVGEALKAFVEELPECAEVRERASFVSDLLSAALSEVDWVEIADGRIGEWLENVSENAS